MSHRLIIAFLSLTTLWYAATLATLLFGFSISIDAFGRGAQSPLGDALMNAHLFLGFPVSLIYLGGPRFTEMFSDSIYVFFIANSALWASLLIFGACRLKKRNARKDQSS